MKFASGAFGTRCAGTACQAGVGSVKCAFNILLILDTTVRRDPLSRRFLRTLDRSRGKHMREHEVAHVLATPHTQNFLRNPFFASELKEGPDDLGLDIVPSGSFFLESHHLAPYDRLRQASSRQRPRCSVFLDGMDKRRMSAAVVRGDTSPGLPLPYRLYLLSHRAVAAQFSGVLVEGKAMRYGKLEGLPWSCCQEVLPRRFQHEVCEMDINFPGRHGPNFQAQVVVEQCRPIEQFRRQLCVQERLASLSRQRCMHTQLPLALSQV